MDYKKQYEELKNNIRQAVSEIQGNAKSEQEIAQNKSIRATSRSYAQAKAVGLFLAESIIDHYVEGL